jgi:alpha-glucosidase
VEREVEVSAWKTGISRYNDTIFEQILLSYRDGFTEEVCTYAAIAGILRLTMPAFGVMILHHKNS